VATWSSDAINLYDLGNTHVVFENTVIETWSDVFLLSNNSGDSITHSTCVTNPADILLLAIDLCTFKSITTPGLATN
jgi:hypothetical protein